MRVEIRIYFLKLASPVSRLMSSQNGSRNFTTTFYRDTLNTAIIKNFIIVVLCISINYVNIMLVLTFGKHQVFNTNPRYILYIHLVINDIILLTMFTLLTVSSYIFFTINTSVCIVLLMLGIFSNFNNPITLAVMSLECYIAICFPLRHSQICTVNKTYITIGLIWMITMLLFLPDLFVVLVTEKNELFYARVFCIPSTVFRNEVVKMKGDITNILAMVVVWIMLFYIYLRVLFTAKAASADTRKARNTVLLHGFQLLLCMLTFVYNIAAEGLVNLFPKRLPDIRFTLSIFIHVLPRLISPAAYGLRDKTFRKHLKKSLFFCESKTEF